MYARKEIHKYTIKDVEIKRKKKRKTYSINEYT